jgi:hypothetical protein
MQSAKGKLTTLQSKTARLLWYLPTQYKEEAGSRMRVELVVKFVGRSSLATALA